MATEISGTTATETVLPPWHYITEMTGTICSEMGGTMATELSRLSSTGRVGRNFLGNDTTHKCLINETLLRVLGYGNPDDVLGMQLNKEYTVTGVVKDYHAMSLHSVIKPALIHSWYQHNGFHIKLATTNGTVHRV